MLFNQKALVSFLSPLEVSVYIDANWDGSNTNNNKKNPNLYHFLPNNKHFI